MVVDLVAEDLAPGESEGVCPRVREEDEVLRGGEVVGSKFTSSWRKALGCWCSRRL